ncbi:class I adenylate-forming enzyme family protein [Microbacterium sp. A93]|uniref:class I adenylate-forming enzyme family protein n=1 Tax=Microbacterium sp. A93 TaxID=3450716 RepID=UPI003F42BF62
MNTHPTWGYTVEPSAWNGHPGLVYRHRPASILEAIVESRRWADRPFIVHGARTMTFREHEQLVHQTAEVLRSRGVTSGQRIGILAANSPEWVATFFAILEVGAVAVPFNGWWSSDEVAHAVEAVNPALIVTDDERRHRVPEQIPVLLTTDLGKAADTSVPWTDEARWADFDENQPAVILFTAGTTAFPKGAVLSHRALVSNLQTLLGVARKLPQDVPDDARPSVTLVGLPLFHIGAIQLVLVPLMTGSKIVFLEGRFDPSAVLRLISDHQATMFSGVPTMMERMLQQIGHDELNLASMRTIILGGAPVDQGLLKRVHAAFPGASRGVGQTYGLTEAGGVVSTGAGDSMRAHPGSSGRLAPVVEVRIDKPDEDGNGEILVRSPACMEHYWGEEESGIDADGWFRTGDLGRVGPDRHLFISGRLKDVIIRGGENISAARVESVLNTHPGVLEVSVVGLPDPDMGEVVGAVIVPVGAVPTEEELELHAGRQLGRFEIPSKWLFRDEPLPTNDSGKVLRAQLKQEWLAWDQPLVRAGAR